MPDASAPLTLWRLLNPTSGKTIECMVVERDGRFILTVSDEASTPVAFDGRVAAIHHAARLATDLRAQGWIDGVGEGQ